MARKTPLNPISGRPMRNVLNKTRMEYGEMDEIFAGYEGEEE